MGFMKSVTLCFSNKNYFLVKKAGGYLVMVLMACVFTACTSKIDKNVAVPFDLPPNAPIPPETFCFEQKNGGIIQLTKTGDSVVGEVEFDKSANLTDGTFVGAIYGTNFFLSYKFNSGNGWQKQDRQWKLEDGILYANFARHIADSLNTTAETKNDKPVTFEFKKIPCK